MMKSLVTLTGDSSLVTTSVSTSGVLQKQEK